MLGTRSPYEGALAASLVAGLTVGAALAAAALITAQAMRCRGLWNHGSRIKTPAAVSAAMKSARAWSGPTVPLFEAQAGQRGHLIIRIALVAMRQKSLAHPARVVHGAESTDPFLESHWLDGGLARHLGTSSC